MVFGDLFTVHFGAFSLHKIHILNMNPKFSAILEGPQQLIFSIFGVLTFLVSSGTLYHLASFLYRTSPRTNEWTDITAPTGKMIPDFDLTPQQYQPLRT